MDEYTNLRMVRDSGNPLGVICERCNHRALVEYGDLISKHGLMRKVAHIRFTCSKCQTRSVGFRVFWKRSEIHRFMRE